MFYIIMSTNYLVNTNTIEAPVYVDLVNLFVPGGSVSEPPTGFKYFTSNGPKDLSTMFAPLASGQPTWQFLTNMKSATTSDDLTLVFQPLELYSISDVTGGASKYYKYTQTGNDGISYTILVFANFNTTGACQSGPYVESNIGLGAIDASKLAILMNFPNPAKNTVYISCVGGGGNGGSSSVNGNNSFGGGGGGGGAFSVWSYVPIPGLFYNITVGGAGTLASGDGTETKMIYQDGNGVYRTVAGAFGGSGGGAATATAIGVGGAGGLGWNQSVYPAEAIGINNQPGAAGGTGGLNNGTLPGAGVDGPISTIYPAAPNTEQFGAGGAGGYVDNSGPYVPGGRGGGGGMAFQDSYYNARYDYYGLCAGIMYPVAADINGGGYSGCGGGGAGGGVLNGANQPQGNGGSGVFVLAFQTDQS